MLQEDLLCPTFTRLKETLAKELSSQKYKKTDLMKIYEGIHNQQPIGKKPEIANSLSKWIAKQIYTEHL